MKTLRPCPVCGNHEADLLHTIRYEKFIQALPDRYDIVSCRICGMVFNETDATGEDYDRYYADFSKYEAAGIVGSFPLNATEAARYDRMCEFLGNHIASEQAVVEIGCGQAGLLQRLKKCGYDDIFGIDPSGYCVDLIRSIGIAAGRGTFRNPPVFERCDCLAMVGVLEHLYDPAGELRRILEHCGDAALVFAVVPSAGDYGRDTKTSFYHFDLEHINHFDQAQLDNLFATFGYSPIAAATDVIAVEKIKNRNLLAIYKKGENTKIVRSPLLGRQIAAYIEHSKSCDCHAAIRDIARSGSPLYLWGCGAHLARLLRETELKKCRIEAFIDNDSGKRTLKIAGRPVLPPAALANVSPEATVAICSPLYKALMREELQNRQFRGKVEELC